MRKRPISYYLVTLVLFGIAFSFPIQVMVNYQMDFGEVTRAFSFLTVSNWLVITGLIFSGIFAFNGSRALYAILPTALLLTIYNNYLVGQWGYDFTLLETIMASSAFGLFCFFPLYPTYFKAMRDPKSRWWLVPERKAIEVPVRVMPALGGSRFHSFTVDMSETGAFIETKKELLDIGDEIDLSFSANSIRPIQIKAEVVRKGSNQRSDKQDYGYGVRFQTIEPQQKKALERFLSTH